MTDPEIPTEPAQEPPVPSPPPEAEPSAPSPEPAQEPPAPPRAGTELTKRPAPAPERRQPAALPREDPTWRELGHWLGLAEAADGSAGSLQAGAAFRLYALAQMDLPLRAAQELTIIRGKLTMSAALLRFLALRSGLRIARIDGEGICTAVLIDRRTGEEVGRSSFTLAEAERAELLNRPGPWRTYPERMLWARASAYVVRDFAPDVALGLQTIDEAAEGYALGTEPIGIDRYVEEYDLRSEADEDIPF